MRPYSDSHLPMFTFFLVVMYLLHGNQDAAKSCCPDLWLHSVDAAVLRKWYEPQSGYMLRRVIESGPWLCSWYEKLCPDGSLVDCWAERQPTTRNAHLPCVRSLQHTT
eukprot:1495963-Amphidinium_carterae.1